MIGSDCIDSGDGHSGDFDMTFQVTRWRFGHYSSVRIVNFNYASEADH